MRSRISVRWYVRPLVRRSVHWSVTIFFECAYGQVMKGAGKGVTREGAIRDGASEEITRGTHLMAMYPALLLDDKLLILIG